MRLTFVFNARYCHRQLTKAGRHQSDETQLKLLVCNILGQMAAEHDKKRWLHLLAMSG